jgi:flagellar protein FliO/FliZ
VSGENVVMLIRLAFSLSLVFGLMWVAAKVLRGRNGALKRAKVDHLEVLERKQLTKNSSIAIVRVAGETLTVGITDAAVSLLGAANLDEPTIAGDEATAGTAEPVVLPTSEAPLVDLRTPAVPPSGKRSLMDALRDMTVRQIPG